MALMTSHHVAMLLLVLTAGHHVLKDLLFSGGVGWKRGRYRRGANYARAKGHRLREEFVSLL